MKTKAGWWRTPGQWRRLQLLSGHADPHFNSEGGCVCQCPRCVTLARSEGYTTIMYSDICICLPCTENCPTDKLQRRERLPKPTGPEFWSGWRFVPAGRPVITDPGWRVYHDMNRELAEFIDYRLSMASPEQFRVDMRDLADRCNAKAEEITREYGS